MLMSRCDSVLTVLRRRGRAPTERADRYLTMLVVLVREVMLQTHLLCCNVANYTEPYVMVEVLRDWLYLMTLAATVDNKAYDWGPKAEYDTDVVIVQLLDLQGRIVELLMYVVRNLRIPVVEPELLVNHLLFRRSVGKPGLAATLEEMCQPKADN